MNTIEKIYNMQNKTKKKLRPIYSVQPYTFPVICSASQNSETLCSCDELSGLLEEPLLHVGILSLALRRVTLR